MSGWGIWIETVSNDREIKLGVYVNQGQDRRGTRIVR